MLIVTLRKHSDAMLNKSLDVFSRRIRLSSSLVEADEGGHGAGGVLRLSIVGCPLDWWQLALEQVLHKLLGLAAAADKQAEGLGALGVDLLGELDELGAQVGAERIVKVLLLELQECGHSADLLAEVAGQDGGCGCSKGDEAGEAHGGQRTDEWASGRRERGARLGPDRWWEGGKKNKMGGVGGWQ